MVMLNENDLGKNTGTYLIAAVEVISFAK